MPRFDSLYNSACWLVHRSSDCEDFVLEAYLKAFAQFHVDVANPEEHVSEFLLNTGAVRDRCDVLRGGRT